MYRIEHCYEDDNFKAYFEISEGVVFMHCSFKGVPTPKVMKGGRDKFEELAKGIISSGIEELYTYSPNPRFVKFISNRWKFIQKLDKDNHLFQLEV